MLQYLIKFSISLAVLFIFYRAFLRPLTFYQCNRFYLLGYSLLSFAIPFIDISSLLTINNHSPLVNLIPSISYYYNGTENTATAAQVSFLQTLTATDWLLLAFGAGVLFMLVRLAGQYFSLRNIRRTAVLLDGDAGIQLYEINTAISPFSFGNAIYFNRQLHTEQELQRIIQHEFVHVKQKHTIDLLVGELLCVVNWFNPFAWMIRYSIRQNLEFIADNSVVATGLDKKEYQYLLLKVVGVPQYSIANNFNFSNLKKRIAMMNKIKSAKLHLTKFLFVLPLLVVLLLAFRKNDHKIAPPVTPASIMTLTDTIPPPPPPTPVMPPPAKITMDIAPQSVNQQGYMLSIADNHGECIVVIKDKSQKIVKVQSLADWNKDKAANENQYGKIPSLPAPPPPPLPEFATIDAAPAVPQSPRVMLDYAPLGPSVVSIADNLPPDVKVIATESSIDKKNGNKKNIATVTLKNGKKEIYDLDKPGERSKFIEKYGKHGELRFQADTMPRPPASPASGFKKTDISERPLFVVDGLIKPDMKDSHSINANEIKSLNILQNKEATDKYGDKGKNGVVEITTYYPGITSDSTKNKNFDADKLMAAVNSNLHPIKEVLIIVDGNEKPLGYDPDKDMMMMPATISSVNVLNGPSATIKYGDKAQKGAAEILTKNFVRIALQVLDGKELPAGSRWEDFVKPSSNHQMKNMKVLRGKDATDKYGDKGKNGVIEVISENKNQLDEKTPLQQPAAFFRSSAIDKMQADSVVTMRTGNKTDFVEMVFNLKANSISYTPADALVLLDGRPLPKYARIYDYIARNDIREIKASIDKSATDKYGGRENHGVIEITTKKKALGMESSNNYNEAGKHGIAGIQQTNAISSLPNDTAAIVWTKDNKTLRTRFEIWKGVADNGIAYTESLPDNISYFINGIKALKEDAEELDPLQVRSAAVLKGAAAVRKYKSDGRNGVLEIALKTRYALASFNVERTMFSPPGTPE